MALVGGVAASACGAFGATHEGGGPDAGAPTDASGDTLAEPSADGALPGDAAPSSACPASLPCASGECSAGKCEPTVFVSMQTLPGNIGASGDPGVRADGVCAAEGSALRPLTIFFAWLGGTTNPVARGLRLVERPYWTPGLGGPVRVADSATALRVLPLVAPIARRDGSAAIAPWTNVETDGSVATGPSASCSGWLDGTTAQVGAVGVPTSAAGGDWAAHPPGGPYGVGACDVARPLYCVEDVTP